MLLSANHVSNNYGLSATFNEAAWSNSAEGRYKSWICRQMNWIQIMLWSTPCF